MHSFSGWRMVVRVMECRGGAPLTNEIKIFKHCFTILTLPHTHTLCYLLATWSREASTWHQLLHHSRATSVSAEMEPVTRGGNDPFTVHSRHSSSHLPWWSLGGHQSCRSYRQPLSGRRLIFPSPLFIAATTILPLTISFRTHHVTMKDAGFKSPSLRHPPSQLALLNQ